MCMSSFSHDLPFEVCEFLIVRHRPTHPWNRVGKVRGQGLARDHGFVLEISSYLFKAVIFHYRNYKAAGQARVDYRSLKP